MALQKNIYRTHLNRWYPKKAPLSAASISTPTTLTVTSGEWTNVNFPNDSRTYQWKVSSYNNTLWEVKDEMANYGDEIECLADGLAKAVASGWITDDEAKLEFRSRVNTVRVADDEAKYKAEKKALLEKELADLEAGEQVV